MSLLVFSLTLVFTRRALVTLVIVLPVTIAAYVELYRRFQGGERIQPQPDDTFFRMSPERIREREEMERKARLGITTPLPTPIDQKSEP